MAARSNRRPSRSVLTLVVCLALTLAFSTIRSTAERPTSGQFPPATGPLPQTAPLDWPEEDLSGRMMDGAHRFVEAADRRGAGGGQPILELRSLVGGGLGGVVDENRDRLREILGIVEPAMPPRLERFGDDEHPALVAKRAAIACSRFDGRCSTDFGGGAACPAREGPPSPIWSSCPMPARRQNRCWALLLACRRDRQFARRLAESGCELLILRCRSRPRRVRPAIQTERPDLARMDLSPGVSHGPPRDRL